MAPAAPAALSRPLSCRQTAAAGKALRPSSISASRLRATEVPPARAAGGLGGRLATGRVADPCTAACCGGGPPGVTGVRGDTPGNICGGQRMMLDSSTSPGWSCVGAGGDIDHQVAGKMTIWSMLGRSYPQGRWVKLCVRLGGMVTIQA
jgi:hypothetical protein